jgi:large subunit ribosomal protein L24
MKLRRDDTVVVIKGRDKGRRGAVQQVFPKDNKVLVEGVNMVTRHMKPSQGVRQAGIITKEMPITIANLMYVCSACDKPSRVGHRFLADGSKARFCKKCEEVIE